MVYYGEVVPGSCLWSGYILGGDTYALRFLFTPKSPLAAVAVSESIQPTRTTYYTLNYSTRRFYKECPVIKLTAHISL